MEDLVAARGQMAMSLAFHILFACAGIAMPLLMVLAERRYLKTGDALDLELAKRWSKGVAILFAVGAVSGTVQRRPAGGDVEPGGVHAVPPHDAGGVRRGRVYGAGDPRAAAATAVLAAFLG